MCSVPLELGQRDAVLAEENYNPSPGDEKDTELRQKPFLIYLWPTLDPCTLGESPRSGQHTGALSITKLPGGSADSVAPTNLHVEFGGPVIKRESNENKRAWDLVACNDYSAGRSTARKQPSFTHSKPQKCRTTNFERKPGP